VTCFIPSPKQNWRNSFDVKHGALSDTRVSGTEELQNIFSLRALIVALVVASLTGISQTNLEKASMHTRMAVLPALLRGSFPT
jgi:hypothetical protein